MPTTVADLQRLSKQYPSLARIVSEAKGLETPWLDPVDIVSGGIGGAVRGGGLAALAGMVPDTAGGIAAEAYAAPGSKWAPLAANTLGALLTGKAVNAYKAAPISPWAPLSNQRGLWTVYDGNPNATAGQFSALHDKVPRVEIDDSSAGLVPGWQRRIEDASRDTQFVNGKWTRREVALPQVFQHPELYRQVPDAANIKVRLGRDMNSTGSYDTDSDIITFQINDVSGTLPNETALHEIQHALQERGGMSRGGSPNQMKGFYDEQMARLKYLESDEETAQGMKMMDRHLDQLFNDPNVTPEAVDKVVVQYEKAYPGIAETNRITKTLAQLDDKNSHEAYRRLAGEIEARDAAARMKMKPEERRRTQPYSSERIPLNQFIVRMGRNR